MGVRALTLNGLNNERSLGVDASAGIPFVIEVQTVASQTTYRVWEKNCPKSFRVVDVWGVMTGAGAASDTIKVTDGTNDITDTVDLSAKSDAARFSVGTINDAYTDIAEGGSLQVVAADDALVRLYILGVWLA